MSNKLFLILLCIAFVLILFGLVVWQQGEQIHRLQLDIIDLQWQTLPRQVAPPPLPSVRI